MASRSGLHSGPRGCHGAGPLFNLYIFPSVWGKSRLSFKVPQSLSCLSPTPTPYPSLACAGAFCLSNLFPGFSGCLCPYPIWSSPPPPPPPPPLVPSCFMVVILAPAVHALWERNFSAPFLPHSYWGWGGEWTPWGDCKAYSGLIGYLISFAPSSLIII